MIKFAIDVSWLRPGKIGGIESYVRNLLDGFTVIDEDFHISLIVSKDNAETFVQYDNSDKFSIIKTPVNAIERIKTLYWTSTQLDKLISFLKVDFCFVPNSRMPLLRTKNRYITTMHDLQPFHYPEYFNRLRIIWLKYSWKRIINKSLRVVVISNFVREDVLDKYHCRKDKLVTIYNPIANLNSFCDFDILSKKYGINEGDYFYTISSLLRHKNTDTLFRLMLELKKHGVNKKLLISGIKGDYADALKDFVEGHKLEDTCIFTGFVTNEERNTLMKHAQFFLFPSIFEGFGMPVVEALMLGTKVITTKRASIEEVSQGKAIYVDNPFDEKEWMQKIKENEKLQIDPIPFREYSCDTIARQYLNLFKSL